VKYISVKYYPVLIITLGIYKMLEHLQWLPHSLLNNYFEDLLAMPLILGTALLFQRNIVYNNEKHCLSKTQLIIATLLLSLFFEVYLPFKSTDYVQDGFDVICYISGTVFFYYLMNHPSSQKSTVLPFLREKI
tara:strand:- start:13873 stop:14271 length:399 start_codon:yes stop_codon:yes gene_type:complete